MSELIYEGAVYDLQGRDSAPLFRYERRVVADGTGLEATHITRDRGGELAVSETARVTPDYALRRFEAVSRQLGTRGSVEVAEAGRRLDYRLEQGGAARTRSERIDQPVVSGPSLHGFLLQHWDRLAAGETLRVRMIVLAKLRTYGFEIRHAGSRAGVTSFELVPGHWLLRLVLAPLVVAFDTATRHVVRYQGRVPPLRCSGRRLVPLDARVDYTMRAAAYR